MRSAWRNENSATAWQIRRSIRSVRNATSSSPSPSRHSFAPYASPTAMRTTEIGACTPPSGTTPGMRRPVRTITLPPISSRRIRFGEPTSPAPSGVTVAAFSPKPCSRTAAAASWTTPLLVARRPSSERSKRTKPSSTPITSGCEGAQRLLEQLLPGLVAFENDDRLHGARSYSTDRRSKMRSRKVPLRFATCFSRLRTFIESRPKERMHGTKDDPRM